MAEEKRNTETIPGVPTRTTHPYRMVVDHPGAQYERPYVTAGQVEEDAPPNIMATLDRELAGTDGWRLVIHRDDSTVTVECGVCIRRDPSVAAKVSR